MSDAALPAVPRSGVWRRAWAVATSDKISLTSAGCAFYAMLALFPAMSLMIAFYGMWFDPVTVEPQLEVLRRLVPESTFFLIAGRVHELVSQPRPALGAKFLVSLGIALWSASAGIRALMGALNLAHDQAEERGVLRYYATAFGITLGAVLAVVVGIALLVGLPKLLDVVGLDAVSAFLVRFASISLLLGFVLLAVSVLYRRGRRTRRQAGGCWARARWRPRCSGRWRAGCSPPTWPTSRGMTPPTARWGPRWRC